MRTFRWVTLAITLLSACAWTGCSLLLWSEESKLRPESVTLYPLLTEITGPDAVKQIEIAQRADGFRLGQRVCLMVGMIAGAVQLLTINIELGRRGARDQ